jgi:four helix bundle protein
MGSDERFSFEDSPFPPARNIAEGKGGFSKKEFIQFLYIGRGSLFETATDVELFRRRGWLSEEDCRLLKTRAIRLGKRMNALINAVKKSTESRT